MFPTKSKNIALVVLVVALVSVGLWWFIRPAEKTPDKTASPPILVKIDGAKAVAPAAQVELPKAPAVLASSASVPSNPLPDPNDPQADLKTAIPDLVHWLLAGDKLTFKKNYMRPNKFTPEQLEQWQEEQVRSISFLAQSQDANLRASIKKMDDEEVKEFESFENQTPTYNSTGDEATYTYKREPQIDGDNSTVTVTFVKINGKWYFK